MKSALVPLDGSLSGNDAQAYAIELAARFAFRLEGLGVVDVPTIESGAAAPIGGGSFKADRDQALIEDARKKVKTFLSSFDEACTAAKVDHGIRAIDGLPYDVINQESRRDDVVIIGSNTCFHFETCDDPGETLGELVKDSSRPLLVVPPKRRKGAITLVTTDGRTASARAVQMFAQLGLFHDQPAHVLNVCSDEDEARHQCEVTAFHLRLHGLDATEHPIASRANPEDVILEHVESLDADLVVMGAHGGGMLHDLFFGGTSSRVLSKVNAPVFIHH